MWSVEGWKATMAGVETARRKNEMRVERGTSEQTQAFLLSETEPPQGFQERTNLV